MMLRLLETDDCETAAGHPGRAVVALLILAALVVLITSVVIAARGQDGVDATWLPSTPKAAMIWTVAGREAVALSPISGLLSGKAGITDDLRD